MRKDVIDSALGFDFSADIIDRDGELVSTGVKTIHPTAGELPVIGNRIGGEKWFTNWNEGLLAKIRDYKRINT